MASPLTKRPLPALVSLLALLLLTALVWWRVMNRDTSSGTAAKPCPTPSASSSAVVLPAPATINVEVLNATKRTGIGAKARTTLVTIGFRIPKPAGNDNPKTKVSGTADIRYGTSGKQGATLLRYYFPGARMVPTQSATATVVVALGDKYRAVASTTAVRAALKADDVQVATVASASTGTSASASC
jgi:hypothetical protein